MRKYKFKSVTCPFRELQLTIAQRRIQLEYLATLILLPETMARVHKQLDEIRMLEMLERGKAK